MVEGCRYNLEKPGVLSLEKVQFGSPLPHQVLAKTIYSAVSPGTEVAAYRGDRSLSGKYIYPRLQGYCNLSEVTELGSDISNVKVGDLILTGASHQSHVLVGQDEVLYVAQANDLPEHSVCSYLYHLGYNAVLKSNVRPGSRVCVIGLGVLGLTSAEIGVTSGALVEVVSDLKYQTDLAVEIGVCAGFTRSEFEVEKNKQDYFDVVILTTNSWRDFEMAQKVCGHQGTIACLGFPGRTEAPQQYNPLDSKHFYYKQMTISAVGFSPRRNDDRSFLRFNEIDNIKYINYLFRENKLKVNNIITDIVRYTDLDSVYLRLMNRQPSDLTFVLKW